VRRGGRIEYGHACAAATTVHVGLQSRAPGVVTRDGQARFPRLEEAHACGQTQTNEQRDANHECTSWRKVEKRTPGYGQVACQDRRSIHQALTSPDCIGACADTNRIRGFSLSLSLSVANPHAKRAPLHSFGVQQAGTPPSSRTPSASARTRWSDEDAMQVLNRAVYLTLLEEPRWGYFHQLGLVGGRSTGTSPSSRPAASPRSLRHRSSTLRRAPPRG